MSKTALRLNRIPRHQPAKFGLLAKPGNRAAIFKRHRRQKGKDGYGRT